MRRDLPSGNALFFFEAAARCGNLTRAAEELYVTQPAVSRMLARMEGHLGIKLFDRVRGGVELTEDGKILYQRITEAFSSIESGINQIQARATGLKPVTLSASTAFTTYWLLPRLPALKTRLPNVDLRVQLNPGRVGEPTIDVDLCIGILRDDERFRDRTVVMPELLLPVCSPDYRRKLEHDSSGAALDTLLLMGDSEYGWQDKFPALASKRHRAPARLRLDDYSVVVQAAIKGQGIALGWLNVVSACLVNGSLLPSEEEIVATKRNCCLISPNEGFSDPSVGGVRDWIIEEMHSDLRVIHQRYPALGLDARLMEAGVAWVV
ncbi:DNA-binding transcriptional LysR family regulator [Rhizobium aquaticum]|uniref:DNA-binding transcriptional LysR family regulator n=1 Tax=Rhizobium aquaticum TaxID=1549636 RepID=A0ABV2J8R4_9HYPH